MAMVMVVLAVTVTVVAVQGTARSTGTSSTMAPSSPCCWGRRSKRLPFTATTVSLSSDRSSSTGTAGGVDLSLLLEEAAVASTSDVAGSTGTAGGAKGRTRHDTDWRGRSDGSSETGAAVVLISSELEQRRAAGGGRKGRRRAGSGCSVKRRAGSCQAGRQARRKGRQAGSELHHWAGRMDCQH